MQEGEIIRQLELDGKKVIVRFPKKDDVSSLLEFINSLVEEGAKILLKQRMTIEKEERFLKSVLESARSGIKFFVCAECEGKVVATASVEKKMKERNANEHISSIGIAILKKFRQMGLGSILMEMLMKYAKNAFKSEIIRLEVYSDNEAALALYKKMGFREAGRIPKGVKYKDKYADEIIMIKELV